MFEIPDAKRYGTHHYHPRMKYDPLTRGRVRRDELFGDSDASSRSGSDDEDGDAESLRARMNAKIAQSLGLRTGETRLDGVFTPDTQRQGDSSGVLDADEDEAEDDGFEFRLFNSSEAAPKIVLEDESEPQGEGGLVAGRPHSSYLVAEVPARLKMQYDYAAVSGEDIMARSSQRFWGQELPWKVRNVSMVRTADGKVDDKVASDDDGLARRKRPGKKRRIALRTKERAQKERREAAAKRGTEKEDHLKDKKKRMNRLKKLRRRAKDREKKMGVKGDAEGSDAGGSNAEGSDVDDLE